jgi:DNA uptake protein ComE-like DNA-binding protein
MPSSPYAHKRGPAELVLASVPITYRSESDSDRQSQVSRPASHKNMSLRRFSLIAVPLLALSLAVSCTRQSQNPEEIREKTAQATANMKADATAVAQGVKEGLTRGNKVDLNNASKNQLMALPGITDPEADRIIANRPYGTPEDLVKKKVLTPHQYDRISGQVGVK